MIEITEAVPENQRKRAGEIYYEAFRRKLQPLVGEPDSTRRALASGLALDMAIGALSDGNLLGLAGLHSSAGIFSKVNLKDCLKQHGWLGFSKDFVMVKPL
jgi:hypothetical protein